ncbi:MAG: aminotransferase class, partial [Actinomycetia bacterium]|nr:aminotransferase class [Actinomycetes bacterium]
AEMSALATATGAINLGQGFPDTDGPDAVLDAAVDALRGGRNQYAPGAGVPELRHAVAEHQRRVYGFDLDPDTEVLITAGATEALTAAIMALCEPGDEVLCFEPYYDSYAAAIALAGAVRRPVTLRAPVEPGGRYTFDPDELRAAVGPRTTLLLLNSPHNPTGMVLTRDELATIAAVCREHDLVAVTDEVYEHLVFDGTHIPLASLPGMRDRTLTISSGGKTFSFTGWKIGWACGPADLVTAVRTAKQFLTYVNGAPFQYAIAHALDLPDAYYDGIASDMRLKRDRLCAGLAVAGFEVYEPSGTYFVTTSIEPFGEHDGLRFCRSLPARCGVVAVPNVVFYEHEDLGRALVRFTFCKRLDVLEEAVTRLKALRA